MKTMIGFMLLFSFSAMAQEFSSNVSAQLVCVSVDPDGDGVVFLDAKDERLWLGEDKSELISFELPIAKFSRYRCPHCYQVIVDMGEEGRSVYEFLGKGIEPATLVISNVSKNNEVEVIDQMNCSLRK